MTTLELRITGGVDMHLDTHVAGALETATRAARRRVARTKPAGARSRTPLVSDASGASSSLSPVVVSIGTKPCCSLRGTFWDAVLRRASEQIADSMRCSVSTLVISSARLLTLVSKMTLMWSGSPSVPERDWLSGRAVAFVGGGGGSKPASAVRPRRP
jgi:hypothetical protein